MAFLKHGNFHGALSHEVEQALQAWIVIHRGKAVVKVSEKFPHLVELRCRNCELSCNACQHCEVEEVLSCVLVPRECKLHNVRRLIKVEAE